MASPMNSSQTLTLYGETFHSRLLLGTSRYPSPSVLLAAIERGRAVNRCGVIGNIVHGLDDVRTAIIQDTEIDYVRAEGTRIPRDDGVGQIHCATGVIVNAAAFGVVRD